MEKRKYRVVQTSEFVFEVQHYQLVYYDIYDWVRIELKDSYADAKSLVDLLTQSGGYPKVVYEKETK